LKAIMRLIWCTTKRL